MKLIKEEETSIFASQFGVALEDSASALTQGYVYGLRYEGWSQRYPGQ